MLRLSSSASLLRSGVGKFFFSTVPKYTVVSHPTVDQTTANDYFAVIKLGGTQYKVAQGDIINAEKIPHAKVGETLKIPEVLLLGSPNETVIGRPIVEGAQIHALVEEQTLDEKIVIFKKKRRKTHRRKNGFRREVTVLRVTDILPQPQN